MCHYVRDMYKSPVPMNFISKILTVISTISDSIIMPGHQKKAKPGEVDPDPLPFLVVTLEMKREFMQKPYDSKKSFWCPDGKGGFAECMLEDDDGTKAKVVVGGFEVTLTFQ